MPIKLDEPLEWKKADRSFLGELQGNILKGHGRENTLNIFLKFDAEQPELCRNFIKNVGERVTSALQQFEDTERFKITGVSGDAFVGFYLSHAGYVALGVPDDEIPQDAAFADGLKARGEGLNDPPPDAWDEHFQDEVHAMLLIGAGFGDEEEQKIKDTKAALFAFHHDGVKILGEEKGKAMKNQNLDGIEHFGYVDGRSQPLLLVEEIKREEDTNDGIHIWNPAFPLRQVLVADKGGTEEDSFGSYFVFRKLEQNVRGFKDLEKDIAEAMGLTGDDAETVGAMLVGRFEDGTPVTLQRREGFHSPVPNNFNYGSDKEGLKCPFHAHIRKTNPRGESVGIFAADEDKERKHIMARRGITYGERVWKEVDGIRELDEDHFPVGGVGLLFMAFQSNISNQFEFTQSAWVNNQNFVKPATGLDPVIGQGEPAFLQKQTKKWGVKGKTSIDFHGFVTMKGGEYFFAPCLSFFR